jgi:hypothetical protein
MMNADRPDQPNRLAALKQVLIAALCCVAIGLSLLLRWVGADTPLSWGLLLDQVPLIVALACGGMPSRTSPRRADGRSSECFAHC